MWVQPSLGVLPFIWENGEDNLCCLHPFKKGRKSQRNVCWRGEELLPMRWPVRQIFEEHLLTEGNTVWTSGNRRLHCVSSILSGFLLCLAVLSLRSLGLSYMVISWEKRTFIHFFWHEGSAWFHWGIPLLSLRWVCGLPSTAANACLSTTHVKELMSYKKPLHWYLLGRMSLMNWIRSPWHGRFEEGLCLMSKVYISVWCNGLNKNILLFFSCFRCHLWRVYHVIW